jgi:DNA-binding response OmpR family regulator
MKILIIDDEQPILKMYADYFTSQGIEALTAEDGDKGLDLARTNQPNIILLDIIMPKLNGLDVLAKIKTDSDLQKIPVILLTNLAEECSGQKAKESGAACYLVKAQTEPKTVLEKIKEILG